MRYETNKSQPPFRSLFAFPFSGFEIRRFIFRACDDGSGAQIGQLAARGPGKLINSVWMECLTPVKDGDWGFEQCHTQLLHILNKPVVNFLRGPYFFYRTQVQVKSVRLDYPTTGGVQERHYAGFP